VWRLSPSDEGTHDRIEFLDHALETLAAQTRQTDKLYSCHRRLRPPHLLGKFGQWCLDEQGGVVNRAQTSTPCSVARQQTSRCISAPFACIGKLAIVWLLVAAVTCSLQPKTEGSSRWSRA
jgi:hypothetical protein